MNNEERTAGFELDRLAQHMAEVNSISYQEALKKVKAQHPKLFARYNGFVESGAKPYGQLTRQEKAMLELVNDSTTTKRFAAHTVDVYAKCLAGIDDRARSRRGARRRIRRLFKRCCGRVQVWRLHTTPAVSIRRIGVYWNCCFRRSLRQNSAALSPRPNNSVPMYRNAYRKM